MTPSRLPYPWKVVVAAAVTVVLIAGVIKMRKHWQGRLPTTAPVAGENASSGIYTDTLARVQEIIAVHTASVPEVATSTMPLVDLGIDPLTRVEVADALESAFRIELASEELAINERPPDRERRRGQLVLSGGGGFGYLMGDRRPTNRFVRLLLSPSFAETTLR